MNENRKLFKSFCGIICKEVGFTQNYSTFGAVFRVKGLKCCKICMNLYEFDFGVGGFWK